MLEREIWKQLPIIPGGLPSIRAALDDPSVLAAFSFDTSNFGEWVAQGNPWHMQAYGMPQPPSSGGTWCDIERWQTCACGYPIDHSVVTVTAGRRARVANAALEVSSPNMMLFAEDEEEEGMPKDSSGSALAEARQPTASEKQILAEPALAAASSGAHANGNSQSSGRQTGHILRFRLLQE